MCNSHLCPHLHSCRGSGESSVDIYTNIVSLFKSIHNKGVGTTNYRKEIFHLHQSVTIYIGRDCAYY